MNYKTFKGLYTEALTYTDVEDYPKNEAGLVLQRIYRIATSDLKEVRNMNGAEFSRTYGIPYRTVQDWDAGRRNPPDYVIALIKYAIFCGE